MDLIGVRDDVRAALADGRPVVALESSVIAHGLPFPINLRVAESLEEAVRVAGATPATVGVIGGRVQVGLEPDEIERLGTAGDILKCAASDLGWAIAQAADGATTVSATVFAAAAAGIDVVATGGIGGVHRGDAGDVSADLPTLAHHPVAVVAAGAKIILDLPRTLEALETLGVPVVGLGTRTSPPSTRAAAGWSWTSTPNSHRISPDSVLFAGVGSGSGAASWSPVPVRKSMHWSSPRSGRQRHRR